MCMQSALVADLQELDSNWNQPDPVRVQANSLLCEVGMKAGCTGTGNAVDTAVADIAMVAGTGVAGTGVVGTGVVDIDTAVPAETDKFGVGRHQNQIDSFDNLGCSSSSFRRSFALVPH